jgi:hypothetical protein
MQEKLRLMEEKLEKQEALAKAKDNYLVSYNGQMQAAMLIRNFKYLTSIAIK